MSEVLQQSQSDRQRHEELEHGRRRLQEIAKDVLPKYGNLRISHTTVARIALADGRVALVSDRAARRTGRIAYSPPGRTTFIHRNRFRELAGLTEKGKRRLQLHMADVWTPLLDEAALESIRADAESTFPKTVLVAPEALPELQDKDMVTLESLALAHCRPQLEYPVEAASLAA